jgi:hypothetical protein
MAIILFFSNVAWADSWHLMQLDSLTLDYKNYGWLNDKNRNALLYPESVKESVKLSMNLNILLAGYLNQSVNGLTTDAQYRGVIYDLELGAHATELFDVYYSHESSHLFDRHHSFMNKFPVEDAIGIRLNIFRSDKVITIF